MRSDPSNVGAPHSRHWLLIGVLTIALAGLVLLLVNGLADDRSPDDTGSSAGPKVQKADRFVDSIGVNIHATYYDTAYRDFERWSALLKDSGIRHLRDGIAIDSGQPLERLQRLARQGHRFTFISTLDGPPAREQLAFMGRLGRATAAVEGPNEVDFMSGADWEPKLKAFMPGFMQEARRAGFDTILAPSLVSRDERKRLAGDFSAWGIPNIHPYPGGRPPTVTLDEETRIAQGGRRDAGVFVTETGYHTALRSGDGQPPVDERTQATYLPRLYLETFAAGVRRTFLYELLDERPDPGRRRSEQNFGLVRNDFTPKPAFTTLRKMLGVLRQSPGEGNGTGARASGPRDLRSLLLEREDGSRVMALWRDVSVWDPDERTPIVVRPETATVTFDGTARDVRIDVPAAEGAEAEQRSRDSAARVDVPLDGDVALVSFR